MCCGGKTQYEAGDGGHLAHAQALGQGVLQIAHLGLAARTRPAALAFEGAFLHFQRNLILFSNAFADLFQLLADVLPVCHVFIFY